MAKSPAVKKQLGPAAFGLADAVPRTRDEILSAVRSGLKTVGRLGTQDPKTYPGYAPRLVDACRIVLDASGHDGAPNQPLSVSGATWPDGLTDADLAIVGSDFGEVSGAVFVLSSSQLTTRRDGESVPLRFVRVYFPSSASNKLVDYVAITEDHEHYNISAKYVKGGAPSISAIQTIINGWLSQPNWRDLAQLGVARETHLNAVSVMSLLGLERNRLYGSDLFRGPIEAAQFLSVTDPSSRPGRAYRALESALRRVPGGDSWELSGKLAMSPSDMQAVVQGLVPSNPTFETVWPVLVEWLTPYWRAAGIDGKFNLDAIARGWARPGNPRFGPLHFPLTYALLAWLNDPRNGALDVLTAAARTLNVCQVRLMNLRSAPTTGLVYRWEPFYEHTFEFWSPSHTVLPLNNRMGFRLK